MSVMWEGDGGRRDNGLGTDPRPLVSSWGDTLGGTPGQGGDS